MLDEAPQEVMGDSVSKQEASCDGSSAAATSINDDQNQLEKSRVGKLAAEEVVLDSYAWLANMARQDPTFVLNEDTMMQMKKLGL